MAKHRALYGWEKPKGQVKPKKEMPFKASRRHEFWSIDVRYIEHHQLPGVKGPVYVISILENFSRMLLASIISEKQDTAAYLRVFAMALRNYGAPEAIVTDGGGIFYSPRALAIYEALDIRPVTVHIYTSTLKVEYQETDLALYTITWHEDNTHITEVTNPHVIETGYRSPQLTLWTLGPDEWLLFKKLPEYANRKKRKNSEVTQLLLPGFDKSQPQAM